MTASPAETRRIVRVLAAGGRALWGSIVDAEVLALPEGPFSRDIRIGESLGRLADLPLLAPTVPTKIIGVGRNYVAHAAEHGVEVPAEPLIFLKPPSSVIGPGHPIERPPLSQRVEHEGELALVIGRRCRHVEPDDAWSCVLGITCGNDVTARDIQRADPQWTRGKGFDGFCPLGPSVVTGLQESEVGNLEVVCRVNGAVRQSGRTSQMVFPPAYLIAYISSVMTLMPGDVILTGTPEGVGPLVAGDVVEVEVAGVGTLSNPVV